MMFLPCCKDDDVNTSHHDERDYTDPPTDDIYYLGNIIQTEIAPLYTTTANAFLLFLCVCFTSCVFFVFVFHRKKVN